MSLAKSFRQQKENKEADIARCEFGLVGTFGNSLQCSAVLLWKEGNISENVPPPSSSFLPHRMNFIRRKTQNFSHSVIFIFFQRKWNCRKYFSCKGVETEWHCICDCWRFIELVMTSLPIQCPQMDWVGLWTPFTLEITIKTRKIKDCSSNSEEQTRYCQQSKKNLLS